MDAEIKAKAEAAVPKFKLLKVLNQGLYAHILLLIHSYTT